MYKSPDTPESVSVANQLLFAAVVVEGGAALLAFALGYFFNVNPAESVNWSYWGLCYAFAIGFLATFPMLMLYVIIYRVRWRAFRRIRRIIHFFTVHFLSHCTHFQVLLICVLAGIGEELLFRGLIQVGISQWIGGNVGLCVGILVSAAIFGLVHCLTKTYTLITFLIGIYFSLLFSYTGNIMTVIVAHALYDYCVMIFVLRRYHRSGRKSGKV